MNYLLRQSRRVVRLAKAWLKFKAHGSPKRAPQYVLLLFEARCEPCPHYDPDLKECSICECPVSPDVDERNKLLWATEECPDKRFLADEQNGSESEPHSETGGTVGL